MQKHDERRFLTSSQVCRRYGSIGAQTLYRWRNDPVMGFPQPRRFGKGRALLFDVDELDAFDAAHPPETARGRAA